MSLLESRLRRARELYATRVAQHLGEPRGASDDDVCALEARVGFTLPAAYREFLGWMGGDTRRGWRNRLFSHDRVFIHDVVQNEEIIDELLCHEGVREIASPRMLVWWVHEVYDSYHFRLPPESDDPMCFRYIEGETSLREVGKFSVCLAEMIGRNADVLDRLLGATARPGLNGP